MELSNEPKVNPTSIEQEAERLYPAGSAKDYSYSSTDIILAQRSAHITCARQYMDTIEKLNGENHKLMAENDTISEELGEARELLEACKSANELMTGEIERLKAENAALIEEIQNWKDELKDQAREHRNNR